MTAIIGAGVFSIVIILSFLIICGLPLGELTMGGQYKVFLQKLERVHINRNARISKRIFRRTRRKFADVRYVPQEFSTKLYGKSAERRALSVNVNTL